MDKKKKGLRPGATKKFIKIKIYNIYMSTRNLDCGACCDSSMKYDLSFEDREERIAPRAIFHLQEANKKPDKAQ
jgi:hypothetical protein